MYSKAKIKGHPIHPMLVAIPITCYLLSLIGFIVYQSSDDPSVFWYRLGYFGTYAGVVSALVAAIPGFIDWGAGIPSGTVAKKTGLKHMVLNLVALAFFVINAFSIAGTWDNPPIGAGLPLALSLFGVLTTLGAGYLGWELVSRHKVGVEMTPEQARIQQRYEHGEPTPFTT